MYCWNCGEEIDKNAVVCVSCGAAQTELKVAQKDNGGLLWGLLGFFIPIVGLILYLVWKDEKPKTAKAAGLGAVISVAFWIIFYIIIIVLGMILGSFMYW